MDNGNYCSSPASYQSPGFSEGCGKQEPSGKHVEGSIQSLGAAQEKAKVFAWEFSSGAREMSYLGLITGEADS